MTETLSGSAQGSQEPGIQSSPEAQGTAGAHTPGPWSIAGMALIVATEPEFPHRVTVARVNPAGELPPEVEQANARLIAAAPDLVAAIEALTRTWVAAGLCPFGKGWLLPCDCNYHDATRHADAALVKAGR